MAEVIYHGVGKRKTSVARVWMKPGNGEIVINKRSLEEYVPRESLKKLIFEPLELVGKVGEFDIKVNVRGGGVASQADAIRYGIAKALLAYDENLRPVLKKAGLLTRDARIVERKKYGRHKARRGFQWRKR
ncbi:small subunit ribosomal protein S9 [Thermosulfidibacter takaii ABI70S6]|uniref:Small ribosomal subunit protein uS9 n=1 Tax=Thermosulfidibacter takaii (strain DSM 17441 / JCM 13301 / NBRC 103674 / ABI70S6) TaxID=1298851 RepID=A0A0S3QRL8_THET7|nr:30S ribosomal protein S9 [Thermosulfidibacter takaii]BAT70974.1 small subunit ribosomal protein S9 [Thermosulfidibacter takaii ABI70S6]